MKFLCFHFFIACTAAAALAHEPSHTEKDQSAMERYLAAVDSLNRGDVEPGREALTRLVDELPYTEGARRAFELARELYRQRGGAADEADFLLGVASRLAWVAEPGACRRAASARGLLALALVEVGRIRLDENGQAEGAVRILQRALPVARGTTWEDDALIWLARALHSTRRVDEALATYQELIATQQTPWMFGAHLTPFYDHALYELGQILEEQQRFAEAQAAYSELCRRAPTSELLDAAALRLHTLQARQRINDLNVVGAHAVMPGASVRSATLQ